MLAPGSRIERNWATEEEQQGNCGREEVRWVTERELLARSSIHSGHNTQTLHYNMDPLLVGQTDIGLHGRLLTSRSSSVVHSSVSVQLRFILFRLQIDSKTDRVSYCTYGMAYSENGRRNRQMWIELSLEIEGDLYSIRCHAYRQRMLCKPHSYANYRNSNLDHRSLKRGTWPRSSFHVPRSETGTFWFRE